MLSPLCLGSQRGVGEQDRDEVPRQALGKLQSGGPGFLQLCGTLPLPSCQGLDSHFTAAPPSAMVIDKHFISLPFTGFTSCYFNICFPAIETTGLVPPGAVKPQEGLTVSQAGREWSCHSRWPCQSHCKGTGLVPRLVP